MPLRSTLAGAATGVVLLGAVFGFAVGLPEWTDDDTDADTQQVDTTPVADLLPDTLLNGGLTKLSTIDPQYQQVADEVEKYGTTTLTDLFGTDVAVGIYSTKTLQVQVGVTIYDGESGLFLQAGPPVPAAMDQADQTVRDYQRIGDAVCVAQWQGKAPSADNPPFEAECQAVVAGRTINVYATPGISVQQTADILDDVAKQGGLS